MKNQKFYDFVKTITGDDKLLAESVISAHQAIYDPDSLTEGRLKDLAKAGLLAGSLATSAFAGDAVVPSPEEIMKEAKTAVADIQEEYLDELDITENDAYANANKRYEELLALDPKAANHFARVINMTLHRKLSIAPPIGKQ
jgi:hypothetical protein